MERNEMIEILMGKANISPKEAEEALENAVSSDLSNGFVEGTNSRLKMVKRIMYGRCRIKLLATKLMLSLNG